MKRTQFVKYENKEMMAVCWAIYDRANWFKRNLYYDFCGISDGVYFTFDEKDWLYIDELILNLRQGQEMKN